MVDQTSRREALKLAGIGSTAFLAGCLESSGADDGNSDESGEANGDEQSDWEDVETIRMLGNASGWIGVEPEMIADEENPTLVLFEGNQYEFTWENDDGAGHNIEFLDEKGDVVNDYETEVIRSLGEEQTLEFEATSEMDEYVCGPHITEMVGDIQVE